MAPEDTEITQGSRCGWVESFGVVSREEGTEIGRPISVARWRGWYRRGMERVSRHRKQMRRWEVDGDVRFVTFSCQRRVALFDDADAGDQFVETLNRFRRRDGMELFAWVVMPEHVHLLVRPAEGKGLDAALRSLKTSVAKRVLARWTESGSRVLEKIKTARGEPRFWQKGGGFDRNVRDAGEFGRTIRYIHRNPVERELVARPDDWKWSSVRWWMGCREGELECDLPPGDPRSWVGWGGYV